MNAMTNLEADPAQEPVDFNDAELRGKSTPAMEAFLAQNATLSLGEVWGLHDRRNTQDDCWAQVSMTWGAWLAGHAGTKNASAWGFSRHPVGKFKEGACVVLGSSVGKSRKAKAMEYMAAMGLDVDSGASLDDVLTKVAKLGLLCTVYTSYNHGKRGLQLKRDDVLRKLQITTDPTLMDIKRYLTQFDKNLYEGTFIDRVTIKEAKKQVKDGVVIELDTPPLEKFRLIFPLEKPVKLVDLAGTHEGALTVWEDKITGLARELLKVNFDTSCTDPGRVFYTARHPKDAADWFCAIVQGDPLKFESVPTYKKSLYTRERGSEGLNAFELAGGAGDTDKPPQVTSPKGQDLNSWHSKYKSRFMLADLLEANCPDRLRPTGSEPQGLVTVECPFEHEHSSTGGSACMAGNSLDTTQGFWTVFCHHSACQNRHKLEFLNEMLRANWFDESLITDREAGYILPPNDQDADDEDEDGEVLEQPAPKASRGKKAEKPSAKEATAHESFDISAPLGDCRRDAWATLEKRFAYVSHGGKPVFFRRVDPTATVVDRVVETFTYAALIEWHENRKVAVKGDGEENPAKSFLEVARRYSGVTFAPPPQNCPANVHNLWSGFAASRNKISDRKKANLVKDFIRDIICSEREDLYKWLYLWLAHTIQRPGEKPGTSLVLNGQGGCGKSVFGEMLHAMCSPFSVYATDPDHVVGKFNTHKATAVMLVSDEALFGGDPKISGIIKAQATGRIERIEPKGVDSFEVPSCGRYVYIGNPKQVIPIELNGSDRRYACMTISNAKSGDTEYFATLADAIATGGLAALMEELASYDPKADGMDWAAVRVAPLTRERRQMRLHSLRPAQRVIVEMVTSGELTAQDAGGRLVRYELSESEETPIEKATLRAAIEKVSDRRDSRADVNNVLEELFGAMVKESRRAVTFQAYDSDRQLETKGIKGEPDLTTKTRMHCFVFPKLGELRARLDEVFAVEEVKEAA